VVAEMFHVGAEIIDDIQDKAQVRRGGEAIHLRYGLDVALSAGSTAWFLPFNLLADYPGLSDGQRLELFRILSRMAVKTHLGQAQDLHYTHVLTPERLRRWANDSLEQRVVEVYEAKTAAFTAAACDGAAVIANADAPTRAACVAFGRTLGLALQIVNDIANFSTERQTRGHGGRDLAEGMVTLVIARALQSLSARDSERLAEIFSAPELRQSSPSLNEGIELIRRSGALKSCEADARRMLEKEWRNLSKVLPPSEHKTMLRVLWSFVLELGDELRYPTMFV
jgi:geranylgeranyl pyrophosphate synthase